MPIKRVTHFPLEKGRSLLHDAVRQAGLVAIQPILYGEQMDGQAIINPAAGGGRCGKLAEEALSALRRQGLSLQPHYTTGPGEATEVARRLWAQGARTFVAVGGDGTSFEVVNGLFPVVGDERPTLGFLTLGTGNSFVRDHGIDSPKSAEAALLRGAPSPCDVIALTHTEGVLHYINLCSIGFSAQVASLTNRRFKRLRDLGYGLAVVVSVARQAHPVLPYAPDEGPFDRRPCTLISFSNSQYTGGQMKMAPSANIADGLLDIIRINAISRTLLLRTFPKIYSGEHVLLDPVESTTAQRVDFDLDGPIDVMIDGEVLHIQPTQLEVLPSALDVLL